MANRTIETTSIQGAGATDEPEVHAKSISGGITLIISLNITGVIQDCLSDERCTRPGSDDSGSRHNDGKERIIERGSSRAIGQSQNRSHKHLDAVSAMLSADGIHLKAIL